MSHVNAEERKKMAALGKGSGSDGSPMYTVPSRSVGTQADSGPTEVVLAGMADKGTDAGSGYVSLG
jgi:hypothetical protein